MKPDAPAKVRIPESIEYIFPILEYLLYQSIPIFIPILAVPGQEPGYSRPPPHPPLAQSFSKKLKISMRLTDDGSKLLKTAQYCAKMRKIGRKWQKKAQKCLFRRPNKSTFIPILAVHVFNTTILILAEIQFNTLWDPYQAWSGGRLMRPRYRPC